MRLGLRWHVATASGSRPKQAAVAAQRERGGEIYIYGRQRSGQDGDAPAHMRPMIRVPAIEVRTIGIVSASSDSNTL